jgi:hypothetical protein
MSYTVPDTEPEKIFQKTTLKWTKELSDYPATTWTLKYYFNHTTPANNFSITATASGTTHSVTVPTTTTDDYAVGVYRWYATVTDGVSTYIPEWLTGEVQVYADPTNAATARVLSHSQTALANIKAVIEGTAASDVLSYTIRDRSLSKMTPEQLVFWKNYYEKEVFKEQQAEAIAKGKKPKSRILINLREG